jgi:hypothetical protein
MSSNNGKSERWSTQEIHTKFASIPEVDTGSSDIFLLDFDQLTGVGIGVDGLSRFALILPGQENVLAFNAKLTEYDPYTEVTFVNSKQNLEGVSILRCHFDRSNLEMNRLVAALLSGIIDIQKTFGKSGDAIWQLKTLFENEFNTSLDKERLTGFVGELLVILASSERNVLVQSWHQTNEGRFDFSAYNRRIEVKANTNLTRKHHFRSSQMKFTSDLEVIFASVHVIYTDWGYSVSDLFQELFNGLSIENVAKIKRLTLERFNATWQTFENYFLDLNSSLSSILFFPASKIPSPTWTELIDSVEWTATIDTKDAISFHSSEFLGN